MTSRREITVQSNAEGLLELLANRGVQYLFGNAGTDFAPIIEAFSKGSTGKLKTPTPITVPHENLAVSMAHGFYLATGQPQAVMVHVNVGTANAICALINAARENVPIIMLAGRTPIYESGVAGSRNAYIHWAQEMFDQAGMVREVVKWDYELRGGEQLHDVVERAVSIATSDPKGPIYLTLPREVLAAGGGDLSLSSEPPLPAARHGVPAAKDLNALAQSIHDAERALCITSSFGAEPTDMAILAQFAETTGTGVCPYRSRYLALPSDHPNHLGYEPAPRLKEADLVLVLEADVPWVPNYHQLHPRAQIVQLGIDPNYQRYPMRSFKAHQSLAGDPAATLAALTCAYQQQFGDSIAASRREWIDEHRMQGPKANAKADNPPAGPITGAWLGDCINELKRPDDIIVAEMAPPMGRFSFTQPGSYFGMSGAGGLGWGLGAALGLKLAAPARRVIAIVGDGSYMFGNPTPAHFVAQAYKLPTLTIITNNKMWGAVRRATLSIYPDGDAARANQAPLTYLEPTPDYEKIVAASGGAGLRVERPEELRDAIQEAFRILDDEQRSVVLNVHVEYRDDAAIADAKR